MENAHRLDETQKKRFAQKNTLWLFYFFYKDNDSQYSESSYKASYPGYGNDSLNFGP